MNETQERLREALAATPSGWIDSIATDDDIPINRAIYALLGGIGGGMRSQANCALAGYRCRDGEVASKDAEISNCVSTMGAQREEIQRLESLLKGMQHITDGAKKALDAKEAENQRLREALEGIVPFIPERDEHTAKWSEHLRAANRIHDVLADAQAGKEGA